MPEVQPTRPQLGIRAADTVRGVKIDGGLPGVGIAEIARVAKELEDVGYDGALTAETNHDPFFPVLIGAEHTERLELGTGIAVAFARNPMTLAGVSHDLHTYSRVASAWVWAARSRPTSRSGSRWSGRTRPPACAS